MIDFGLFLNFLQIDGDPFVTIISAFVRADHIMLANFSIIPAHRINMKLAAGDAKGLGS